MIYSYKNFIKGIITEELHPELQEIIKDSVSNIPKQQSIANKIKDLTERGEKTGAEGNMPSGSGRAYIKHSDHLHIILDGKPAKIRSGIKVAITGSADEYHEKSGGLSVGALQNKTEGGDPYVNGRYRILTRNQETKEFHTNTDHGIFPPLFDHDHENHEWSHVGHVSDITKEIFKKLTKTESFPNGISHEEFSAALNRMDRKKQGRYWPGSSKNEGKLDTVESHPLVQKFIDYHTKTGHPSSGDYNDIENMGIFNHPDGSRHIVARDHGYGTEVATAYYNALKKKFNPSDGPLY